MNSSSAGPTPGSAAGASSIPSWTAASCPPGWRCSARTRASPAKSSSRRRTQRSSTRSSRPTGRARTTRPTTSNRCRRRRGSCMFGPDPKNTIMSTVVVMATSTMRHSQNWTPDFSKILTRGVKGIREEAQAKLAALSEPRDLVNKKAVPRSRHHHLRRHDDLVEALCEARRRAGREGEESSAEEGAAGDRRGVRMGSGEPGAHLPGGAPGPVVGPDVQPHRADLERHGPGPVGPVSVAVLPEGPGRGPDHQGIGDGVAPLRLAATWRSAWRSS